MSPDRLDVLAAQWREALAQLEQHHDAILAGELTAPPETIAHLTGQMEMLRTVLRAVEESA